MIKINIGRKKYKVCNEWKDLTPSILHTIKSIEPIELVKALTDIPEDVIEILSESSLMAIYQLVSFVEDSPKVLAPKKVINVASESWKKLESTKQALQTKSPPYIATQVAGIYFGDEVYKWSIPLVYGQTSQILESLFVFLERYKELNEGGEYDEDQLEAGVEGFETFGVGAIRYSLAKGDVTKYKDIEEQTAEDVYFTLLYEKAVNKYQKELKRIYDRQNGINSSKNS